MQPKFLADRRRGNLDLKSLGQDLANPRDIERGSRLPQLTGHQQNLCSDGYWCCLCHVRTLPELTVFAR